MANGIGSGWLRNIPTDVGLTRHTKKLWAETEPLRAADLDREPFLGYSLKDQSEPQGGNE